MKNERPYILGWIMVAVGSLMVIWLLLNPAEAGDLKLGLMLGSDHRDSHYSCDGKRERYNETNPGLYVIYKGVLVGRYENSYSGCGVKYSNVIGYEAALGSHRNLDFSVTAGLADGYGHHGNADTKYQAWASINMKWNLFGKVGPKMFYGYIVSGYSLEGEL